MGDQARALGCDAHEISSIEIGRIEPSQDYIERFRRWLNISEAEYSLLLKRGKSNVVGFDPQFSTKNNSNSMRLFRKVSNLAPSEIRAFRKKIEMQTEAEND